MIASILSSVVKIIQSISDWIIAQHDALLLALGRSQHTAEAMQERINALQKANAAREAARADAMRSDADGVPDDDGFQRKDD